jgi:1-acyl-sn-glycerol-3-phosphate acyltransferase
MTTASDPDGAPPRGRFDPTVRPPLAARILYWAARMGMHLVLKVWNRYEVHGVRHLPASGGFLLAANHTSYLDPAALSCGSWHLKCWFLARNTLYGGRRFFFQGFHCIPIDRDRGEVAALRVAIHALRSGQPLALFPEGTRSPDGLLQPARNGIGFIAARAGTPVVPVWIDGAFAAYSRHARGIRPHKIRVTYGPPIPPEEIAALAAGPDPYARITRRILRALIALGARPSPALAAELDAPAAPKKRGP